jgi:hypothetical protein
MATQWGDSLKITGLVATGDLSAKQFQPVKPGSTAGTVKVAVLNTDKVIGILVNDPVSGEAAEIVGLGNAKAKLAASVAAGDLLTPNTTGYLKATTTAGDRVCAIALEASGAAGYIHPVFVVPGAV